MRRGRLPTNHRRELSWNGRSGFAWLALRTGSPVVLAPCPAADDIYHVYDEPVTAWLTERLHVPFAVFRGMGPTWIPRPVELVHEFAPPLYPPRHHPDGAEPEEEVSAFQREVQDTMTALLGT